MRTRCGTILVTAVALVVGGVAYAKSVAVIDGETLPGQGVERLTDGEINPTCAWRWDKKPIRVARRCRDRVWSG